jgi:hypothetical protein
MVINIIQLSNYRDVTSLIICIVIIKISFPWVFCSRTPLIDRVYGGLDRIGLCSRVPCRQCSHVSRNNGGSTGYEFLPAGGTKRFCTTKSNISTTCYRGVCLEADLAATHIINGHCSNTLETQVARQSVLSYPKQRALRSIVFG